MEFDYYFPLFSLLMHGQLNPELPTNAESQKYTLRIELQIRAQSKNEGKFSIYYFKPLNLKCVYYQKLLLSETKLYCEDILEYLQGETDTRIRTYLRDQILDKHLTTCLERIGEKIKLNNYRLIELENPAADADRDRLSNIYIYHLLKVCIVKAYLEIQEQLVDVIIWKRTEEMLYLGLVKELAPLKKFLQKREKKIEKESREKQTKSSTDTTTKKSMLLDSKEVMKVLEISESSLYRLKKSGCISPSVKKGKKDMYDSQKIMEYRDSLGM